MPNWIEGTFRARGEKENIKKFIMEGLQPVSSFGESENISRELYEYDDDFEVQFTNKDGTKDVDCLHIESTRRNFVEGLCIGSIFVHKKKGKGEHHFALSYRGAWSIDTDAIKNVAEKYKIDIHVNGYEQGMQFEQEFEVSRDGTIRKESFIQYDDYEWECKMPLLGG